MLAAIGVHHQDHASNAPNQQGAGKVRFRVSTALNYDPAIKTHIISPGVADSGLAYRRVKVGNFY
jgi:hypothetical protein